VKVARSVTPREVTLAEVPDPDCGPGEVVVALEACGVCGSDVSEAWVARKLPAVLGHELVGRVLEDGAGAVAPGTRVVVHHHAACQACALCRAGRETLCPRFRATALDPGGFAERIRVPAELVGELLPTPLDAERATFVEPLACVLRAFDRAALRREDTLLVVGAGSSGLLAVAAARARGVRVQVREPAARRRELALALGAEAHDGAPADVVLLCAPGPAALADAFAATGPAGRLVVYATPKDGPLAVDAAAHYAREVTLVASYSAGRDDMRRAHDLLVAGAVDPAPLITHRLGLHDTARALELARTGAAVKALVVAA
jgi:L-iditol 2-dehydrogenase